MKKIFVRSILALLLAFFGIAGASAGYTVVPVKQYKVAEGSLFYSEWYLQYHNELGKEHNGRLYKSAQYHDHYELWKYVEGFTEKDVIRNRNKILTVPVSGHLAESARFFTIMADAGNTIPDKVMIGEKTYVRSIEKGKEKLFTVVPMAQAVVLPVKNIVSTPIIQQEAIKAALPIPVTQIKPAPTSVIALVSDVPAAKSITHEESLIVAEIILGVMATLLFIAVLYLAAIYRRLKKNSREERAALIRHFQELKVALTQNLAKNKMKEEEANRMEEVLAGSIEPFILENPELLSAVISSEKPPVYRDNTIFLPVVNEGKEVVLPNGTTCKRKPKNILATLRTHYLPKAELATATA
jgi:hypothetical protein